MLAGALALGACGGSGAGSVERETTSLPACEPSGEPLVFERSPSGAPEVTPQWLAAHRCEVRVVDLRAPEEIAGELGHVEGAESAPLERLQDHAASWRTDEPIVVVDRSGRRAARAQELLEALGFERVASMTGGMLAWRAAGLPTTRAPVAEANEPQGAPVTSAPSKAGLGFDPVAAHLADRSAIRWMSAAELMTTGTQACIDGREDAPVIGTPGGDAGELVLALAALEQTAGRRIDLERVPAIYDAYVQSFGRFYVHSDQHAMERLAERLRADPRFEAVRDQLTDAESVEAFVRHPPAALEDALLEHLTAPEAVGCGHLRTMLQNPSEYGARRDLTEAVLRAAFRRGWERPESLRFVVLEGEHEEAAVVRVRLEHEVHAYTRVPMFAPHARGVELFVAHPDVSRYVRHENGAFLLEHADELVPAGRELDDATYVRALDELAERQVSATLGHLAAELPVYEVRFHGETPEVVGPVPSNRCRQPGAP